MLVQQISDEPAPPGERVEGLGGEVTELVMAMLNKNPDERVSGFQDIRAQLQSMQG